MRIIIIGLGGIGGILAKMVDRNLGKQDMIVLVDKDKFEEKNRDRQEFKKLGNKAKIVGKTLRHKAIAIPEYITSENKDMIRDEDIVMLCVDNHATRLLVSKRCQKLSDIILISGGNELIDGNVQIYIKKDGKEITEPIEKYHPEIQNPVDENPGESCQMMGESEPQVLFTNNMVASIMLNALWNIQEKMKQEKLDNFYSEVYFDIVQNKAIPIERKLPELVSDNQ